MLKMMAAVLLCCLLLCPGALALDDAAKLEALYEVSNCLTRNHPGFDRLVNRDKWDAAVRDLADRVPTISDDLFPYALMELPAMLGDAHTQLWFTPEAAQGMRVLPIQVAPFDEGYVLLAADAACADAVGLVLTHVGDTPIDEVYGRFGALLSYDNEARRRTLFAGQLVNADALFYLGVIPSPDAARLTFEGGVTVTVQSYLAGDGFAGETAAAQRAAVPEAQNPLSLYYAYAPFDGAIAIAYLSCQEDPERPMAGFVESMEQQIRAGSPARVIVDLRYNGGGNSSVFEPMIALLAGLREEKGFALYCLIGENTFSSGVMNACQLKRDAGAILVGQPTGGSVNHYGELKTCALAGMPMTLYYSSNYFQMDKASVKGSLAPDVAVPHTFADWQAGIDPEMESLRR